MMAYWGAEVYAFLTSALDWSASRPDRFTPRERAPGIHWIGSQSRSGRGGEEKTSQPLSGLEPQIIQLVAQRYTTELFRPLFYMPHPS
jgi:hypothetical protein